MKGICTECFLQMKMPNSTQLTQYPLSSLLYIFYVMAKMIICVVCIFVCIHLPLHFVFGVFKLQNCKEFCTSHILTGKRCPFCKTTSYVVEYRGIKTKEEKGLEQLEE